ncbi:VOC family protein [Listeria costaricensis]|uniref:VOC family protein n=1 Tax=Listeria costaricensis TaxID=2026604 RepID=UPI000C080102|nr:VOC family protein [Listeria costaricensis]
MKQKEVYTFLTFPGTAEEAVAFYVSLFDDAEILDMTRITERDRGEVGKILNLTFTLAGQNFMALDMEEQYFVPFSWTTSILIDCPSEAEFDRLFEAFSKEGQVMMGPEEIGPLKKAAWVTDRYGVTWQVIFRP